MKKALQFSFGIAVSGLFLWLAFRQADFGRVLAILSQARMPLVGIAIALGVLAVVSRSYRWKLLGRDYHGVPYRHFFRATSMGLMINTFLPFRTGDLFQGYFIARSSGLPQSYTLATVFMERMMDFVPPALMLVIGSFFVVLPSQIQLSRLALLFVPAALGIVALVLFRRKAAAAVSRFVHARHGERLGRVLENVAGALVFLRDRQVLTRAFPLTCVNWFLLSNTATLCLLWSLGIKVTFLEAFLIQGITVMSVAIPSSPGFVGTWEFFCLLALSMFAVDRERALSYAVLSHFIAFLPIVVFGLFFLIKDHLVARFLRRTAA